MATIKVKRSAVAGRIPATTDLELGEIAINTYDGVAYIKKNVSGTETVVSLGGNVELSQNLQNRYQYTATANQTTFAAVYLAPYVDVYLNGVRLLIGVEFTATDGTSIVLASGASAGNVIDIVAYTSYTANANFADLNSTHITTALGFTPYNATNPSNFITQAQARSAISASGSLSYNSSTGVISYTTPTTSGITEGTNLYFTDARARGAVSAGTGLTYNSSTGVITNSITQYTDALARAAISVTGAGSYNSTTGVITVTGGVTSVAGRTGAVTLTNADVGLGSVEDKSSATIRGEITSSNVTTALGFTPYNATNPSSYITSAGARSAISATGSLSYNSTTGVLSYTAPTAVSAFTNDSGYLTANQSISVSGDATGSGATAITLTLANSGVTAGTYTKTTVDAKGRVTSGTTLSASDIPALDASKITTGVFDAARLPSYVDDVLEYANLAGFPASGETGKIYVALDTNKTYRWSGSAYVYITSGAVDSVAGKTGVVTLTSNDVGLGLVENKSSATIRGEITSTNVTSALGFTPYNATNPSGYTNNTGTVTSVNGTGTVSGLTLTGSVTTTGSLTLGGTLSLTSANVTGALGFTPYNATNPAGYITGITSGMVTTALGFTPYNATNPAGYITSAALGSYLPLTGGTLTGQTTINAVGSANSPTLRLNTSTSGAFVHTQENLAANLTAGQHIISVIGKVGSTKNSGYIGYTWAGDASNSNFVTIGHWGNDDLLRVYGDGNVTVGTNTVLHAGNYNSYSPTLTGGGASGTWGINITGNAGTATKVTRKEVAGYLWDGTTLSTYWTKIGRVSGDASMMVSIYGSTDSNYSGAQLALATFKSFSGGSVSAQLDSLTANSLNANIAIDNSGDCWIYISASWSSFVRYSIDEQYNCTIYSSPTQQITTPANSKVLGPGQGVRATSGNVTGASVYNTGSIVGDLTVRGSVSIASNTALHAGNYNSYAPTLTGTGASGTWGINITGNAATATSATDSTKLPLTGGTATNVTLGVRVNNSTYGGNTTGMSAHSFPVEIRASGAKPTLTWHYESVATRHIALDGDGALNLYNPGESGGAVFKVGGNVALHAGNYNSYALPLSGGTLTGTLGSARNDNQRIIESYNTSAGSPTQFFIEHSLGGVNIGNARGNINISSGSLLHGSNQVLHAGNYTSYSPTLTGGSASGTWGISITGNSATVGGLAPAQFFNNMGNSHGTYTDFNSVPGFGAYYVQQGTNSPTGVAANQWYGFTLGLGNQYSLADYGTQIYWPRRAQNGDTYIYIRDREGGSWTSWTKVKAGYADTAGSATDSSKLPLTGGSLSGNLSITPVSSSWAEGLAFEMPNTSTWGGLRWRRNRAGADGNWYIGFTALDSSDDLVFGANNGGSQIDNILRMTKAGVVTNNGNQILHAGNSQNYRARSLNSVRTSNTNFNDLSTALDTFTAGTNYIPSGGAYNQPDTGDHHYLAWGGIEGSAVWGAQFDIDFYTDRVWFRRQSGASWQAWRQFIHDGNYSSYALPLSGGAMSGNITFPNDSANGVFNAAGNAGYRPDDQYGNTYMFNTAGAGGWYGDFSSYYFRSTGSSNWLTISGSAVNSSVALQQSGNQVLHAGNYTNYVNAKGGSWYGSGLPGSRWGGYSTSGGEISFGDGLPNAGQMGILLDGCYVAGENNGFWSMGSDNTWGSRRGMYWDGSFLNFTTNTPTARFQNVQVDAQLTAANIAIGLGRSSLNAIGGNIGATTPSWNNSQLEIRNSDAGTVAISLHRAGYTSNTIDVRDGSGIRIDGNIALHAANFSSYALPLSGGTISGNQTITGNLTVSSGNTTGNGIILADDGDIVDLNDAYCSMRFSYGVRVFSANRGGSAVHTLHSNGTFTASGNVTAYSDERLKTDWTPVPENFVERLAKVKSGTYTRLDNNKRQAGSSAQDWQQLLPEVVTETDNEDKTLSLAYGNAALVSAVELAKEVIDLRAQVTELRALIITLINKDLS
jgi:hypothetical protein